MMGSPDARGASLTVGRGQVGPFHPRAPALSREVIETRHPPLQSGHCCRRAFTHRHHRRGRAPARRRRRAAPSPAPPRARLPPPPFPAHSLHKRSAGRQPLVLTPSGPSGKCSLAGGAGAHRVCMESASEMHDYGGEKETRAPGPPPLAPVHTFFLLPAHSLSSSPHTRPSPPSRASARGLAPQLGLAAAKRLRSPVDRTG